MSTFERDNYRWRETYWVLFDSSQRPSAEALKQGLAGLNEHFEICNFQVDDDGEFESATLVAPEAYAALDISYLAGEEVLEQSAALHDEMRDMVVDEAEMQRLSRLPVCDARFDVLHFEEVVAGGDDEVEGGMLDPSALLLVLTLLGQLTDGLAIDPQAGTIM